MSRVLLSLVGGLILLPFMLGWASAQSDFDPQIPHCEEVSVTPGDLFVEFDPESADALLEDWRWKVGAEAKICRVSVFGDLFIEESDGSVFWLDTGRGEYSRVAGSLREWADLVSTHTEEWFHWGTLQELRSLGVELKDGYVFDWIKPPMLGGEVSVNNVQWVGVLVHVSASGQLAKAIHDLPPGADVGDLDLGSMHGRSSDSRSAASAGEPARFNVVINEEEQYSMWPVDQEIPDGWNTVGVSGTKQECLDYIERVWVDMRPKSLRKKNDGRR